MSGTLDGKKVVVQGLGNVGYHAASFLAAEDGCKIVGIVERDGALVDDDGLNGLSNSCCLADYPRS